MNESENKKVKISDLTVASAINDTDISIVVQGTGDGETTKITTISDIGNFIAKDKTFSELTTTNKNIIAAINEAATSGTEILSGTSAPTSSQGQDNNLYIQYTEGVGGANDTVDALFVKLDGAWCEISTSDVGTLDDLSDVTITTPSNNDALMYNDSTSEWENKPILVGNMFETGNIGDVNIDDLELWGRQTLLYDDVNDAWVNGEPRLGHTNATSDFSDVYLSQTIANNDLLVYDSAHSRWANSQLYREITGTLTIGSTSVVLTNTYTDVTVANASLEVFTDTFGVNPTDITISGNNISLTFEAQSSTVNVKVRLWK